MPWNKANTDSKAIQAKNISADGLPAKENEAYIDCYFSVPPYADGWRARFPLFGESAKRNQGSTCVIGQKSYLCT